MLKPTLKRHRDRIYRQESLPTRRKIAASMVAAGASNGTITRKLNITDATLCTWKRREDFRAHVDSILSETEAEVRRELRALGREATRTLRECLKGTPSEKPRWSTKVKGALRLLQLLGIEENPNLRPIDDPPNDVFL